MTLLYCIVLMFIRTGLVLVVVQESVLFGWLLLLELQLLMFRPIKWFHGMSSHLCTMSYI